MDLPYTIYIAGHQQRNHCHTFYNSHITCMYHRVQVIACQCIYWIRMNLLRIHQFPESISVNIVDMQYIFLFNSIFLLHYILFFHIFVYRHQMSSNSQDNLCMYHFPFSANDHCNFTKCICTNY